jgi:carbon-monoxide dehydrogenase medium subunit
VKPAPFVYHLAQDVDHAVKLLADGGTDAKVLAGGQSLVPMMNLRLVRPTVLVDINRIAGLGYVHLEPDGLHVGPLTTHRSIEVSTLPEGFLLLPRAARWIGHYPIRCRGTFGGSLAHGEPTAEWCLVAVLMHAVFVLQGMQGIREISASDFYLGRNVTAAGPTEILVDIRFPRPSIHAALTEFAQRRGDPAIVAAAVSLELDGDNCLGARVALGGVGKVPTVLDIPFSGTANERAWKEIGLVVADQVDPISDHRGDSHYRRHLVATLVERALAEATA